MKKKSDLQKLSTNLQNVFGGKNWQVLWQTHKLVEHWPEVAGKTIASKSMPAYIRKNILWIYVHDSIWMQHLHAQKTLLLEKVRNFHNSWVIEDIRWLLQQAENKDHTVTSDIRRTTEIDPEEQKDFETIAASVENEQCRNALCRLWQIYHKNRGF